MTSKKMIVRIGKDGKSSIRVQGAEGPECVTFTKAFEELIGEVETRELTEDYYKDGLTVNTKEDVSETL